MPKIIQISLLPGDDQTPPSIAALRGDGSVFVYRPSMYVGHGDDRQMIDEGGWVRIPPVPEDA